MKNNILKFSGLSAIIFSLFVSFAQAQTGSGLRDIQPDNTAEARINQVTDEAGKSFKEGLLGLADNRRSDARDKFDKSVEVFLTSGVNVRSSGKLQSCYTELVETIYRMEFPSAIRQPDIKHLSTVCEWKIDNQLAEQIAKLSLSGQGNSGNSTDVNSVTATVAGNQPLGTLRGFSEQRFEPSPLDELSKLELTPDEQNVVYTAEGQREYQLIQVAVNGGSLGFKFQMDPRVQQFIGYYQGRGRGTMETGLYRSGMFMSRVRRIFREEGIPENVAWLAQVESTWKPSALSVAAASGLWQFIPGTGTRFGLKRTAYVDERNSFEKATHASAQYLRFLANRYGGNWELAMAAYNSGEGNVDRAISRAGVSSFWAAYPYLPQETRNYVPNILATILIANSPQKYGFGHVRPAPQLMYDQIRVPSSTSLGLLAQSSDTSVEYLRYLNPELRSNTTPPEPYIIRVPAGKANGVVAVLKRVSPSSRNTASVANTMRGETWENIANRTGVSVEQLQAVNGGSTNKPGKKVVVPTNNVRNTAYVRPNNPIPAPTTGGVRIVKAQKGDTVAKIAARLGVSAVEVAKFNGLFPDSQLSAGREIKIPSR